MISCGTSNIQQVIVYEIKTIRFIHDTNITLVIVYLIYIEFISTITENIPVFCLFIHA